MTQSLRQPIRHLYSITPTELGKWSTQGNGKISGALTEKTDGMAFEIGCDEIGFYSRTSHSKKMRQPGDYISDAYHRFGFDIDSRISNAFAHIHYTILKDEQLRIYLYNAKDPISGEVFYPSLGKRIGNDKIQFVGTAYDINKLGSVGTFIIHTQCNAKDIPYKTFNGRFKWDTDLVTDYVQIDPLVFLMSKDEIGQMSEVYRYFLNTYKPKWGDETEGYVIHPDNENIPKLKIVDPRWSERRVRMKQ